MRTVAVVGASLAGLSAARPLRRRAGRPIAVLGMNQARLFTRRREHLAASRA